WFLLRAQTGRWEASGTANRRDDDIGSGNVVVVALAAGRDGLDLVHDVHAGGHLAEYAVAVVAARLVEPGVVLDVDAELRRGAVRVIGAGHRDRTARIRQAVSSLVLNGGPRFLLAQPRLEAAPLDHEVRDDAMEDRSIEKTVVHVLQEVGDGEGGLVAVEL